MPTKIIQGFVIHGYDVVHKEAFGGHSFVEATTEAEVIEKTDKVLAANGLKTYKDQPYTIKPCTSIEHS
jgi:hypothetical protein